MALSATVSLNVDNVSINDLNKFKDHVVNISDGFNSNLIVTIGEKGVVAVVNNKNYYLDAHKIDVVDTTGAGDCFCGTFVSCLSNNTSVKDTLKYSNLAASLSVQALGSSSSYPSHYDVIKGAAGRTFMVTDTKYAQTAK